MTETEVMGRKSAHYAKTGYAEPDTDQEIWSPLRTLFLIMVLNSAGWLVILITGLSVL